MENQNSSEGNLEYDWRQTDEDIYIDFNLNGEIKKGDVELKLDDSGNTCVCQISFKDVSKWVCALQHTVILSSADVKVKDGALIVHLQKREKYKEWKRLGDCVFSEAQEVEDGSNKANENGNPMEETPSVQDEGSELSEGQMKGVKEEIEEEYVVHHVKHDFFSRQDLKVLYLHVYVKKIEQESVVVTFGENEICIKFKTNDNQFLQLNPGSTSDTLFCWRIRTWKPIDPEGCHHNVTKSNLEVNIKKQKAEKWKALECSAKRKDMRKSVPQEFVDFIREAEETIEGHCTSMEQLKTSPVTLTVIEVQSTNRMKGQVKKIKEGTCQLAILSDQLEVAAAWQAEMKRHGFKNMTEAVVIKDANAQHLVVGGKQQSSTLPKVLYDSTCYHTLLETYTKPQDQVECCVHNQASFEDVARSMDRVSRKLWWFSGDATSHDESHPTSSAVARKQKPRPGPTRQISKFRNPTQKGPSTRLTLD